MSFKPPFLCYPVEETEGYVIRIKPEEEGEECFDFALDFDNSTAFLKAALETLGAPETDEDEDEGGEDDTEQDRRYYVLCEVVAYTENNLLAPQEFYEMLGNCDRFVETGDLPKPTKLTRVK